MLDRSRTERSTEDVAADVQTVCLRGYMKLGTRMRFCRRDPRLGPKHEMVGDNVMQNPNGTRQCRACNNEHRSARREAGPVATSLPAFVYQVPSDVFIEFATAILLKNEQLNPAAVLADMMNNYTRGDK